MPQMSPMNWTFSLFMFLIPFLILISLIYFEYFSFKLSFKLSKPIIWIWKW